MHIHGYSMNVNAANFYSVGNGEKAAAAERAAGVRKRLLKSAASVDEPSSPEETLMISHWFEEHPGQTESGSEYSPAAPGKDSDLG